jgi:hypothetical protein
MAASPLEPGDEATPLPRPAEATAPALAKNDPQPHGPLGPFPGGEACLRELGQRGVVFSRREAERGVPTPILVKSDVGGVHFFSDGMPFIADCRLVLALTELGPELAALGVSQMRFSGAYAYRYKPSGRLSLHAHGLAIDVHEIWFGGERLSVRKDFARGLGRECAPGMPRLNELACRVRQQHLFKELLTPDDNADHYDHFHFGLAPLPGELPPEPPPVLLRHPTRKAPAAVESEDELPPLEDGLPEIHSPGASRKGRRAPGSAGNGVVLAHDAGREHGAQIEAPR